jgi:hypothetical protein
MSLLYLDCCLMVFLMAHNLLSLFSTNLICLVIICFIMIDQNYVLDHMNNCHGLNLKDIWLMMKIFYDDHYLSFHYNCILFMLVIVFRNFYFFYVYTMIITFLYHLIVFKYILMLMLWLIILICLILYLKISVIYQ